MNTKRTSIFFLGFFFAITILAAGCGDSGSESTGINGGDTPVGAGCETNEDCMVANTNRICSTTGSCIDKGDCLSDEDCREWYGGQYICDDISGLCLIPDINPPDGDDQAEVEQDNPVEIDGDTDATDGEDARICSDFSGLYEGEFTCPDSDETLDVFVVVSVRTCELSLSFGDSEWSGFVDNGEVTLTEGNTCSGQYNTGDGTITLSCDDGCEALLTPKGQDGEARIQARPTQIRFGAVSVGETVQQMVEISNIGDEELVIYDVKFSPDTPTDFAIANPEDWEEERTLDLQGRADIWVSLQLLESDALNGTLVVLSNASNSPVLRIPMESQEKEIPLIEVDPPQLSFGSVPPATDNIKYFLIVSAGGAQACIEEISFEDDDLGSFVIVEAPATPFCLDAGTSEPVQVNFHPEMGTGVNHSGQVKIVWLDKNEERQVTFVDLLGQMVEMEPPCIDIQPLGGNALMGMLEFPGPGVKWGFAQENADTTRQVTIRNCGDMPLEISSIVWSNPMMQFPPFSAPAFWEVPGEFQSYTLLRDESIVLDIIFHPWAAGVAYSWSFNIAANAEKWAWLPEDYVNPPDQPPLSQTPIAVGVKGTGARKGIDVLPTKIDFGMVTIECCSRPENVNVWNIGDAELYINSIEIGAGSDEEFRLANVPSNFPYILGGAGHPSRLTLTTQFCPTFEGMHEGRIEITSDDQNNAQFIVPLRGEGTWSSHHVDTFNQINDPKVDILWVVDCSGSMGDEQDNLATNFESFIEQAVDWNADLQIAVSSTDVVTEPNPGIFQCGGRILKNRGDGALSNDEMISEFTAEGCIRLGTDCDSGRESGLEAGHAALSPPLNQNQNAGFVREDAKLALIFVSDEEDQSISDVAFFIDYFRAIKGTRNTNMLEVYAIVGDSPNGCATAAAGKRYIEVADACNPHDDMHFMSICSDDYQPVYDTLAENLFALRNQFFLSRLADPDTIVVTINGEVASEDYWTYHEPSNSITFPADDPPERGAEITVEYDTLCIPR